MTLAEYNIKRNNIKVSHPAPAELGFTLANRHYRKIIDAWQLELSQTDREMIQSQERRFADRMAS